MTKDEQIATLRPCPNVICPSHREGVNVAGTKHTINGHWVSCAECSAQTDYFNTEAEAIHCWNDRPASLPSSSDAAAPIAITDAMVQRAARAMFDDLYNKSPLMPWDTYGDQEAFINDAKIALEAALGETP